MNVNENEEALEVLLILRRRLLSRMANVIVANREALLNGHSEGNNPLGHNADLAEIIKSLDEIDGLIAGLVPMAKEESASDSSQVSTDLTSSTQSNERDHENQPDDAFLRFRQLVAKDKMEEASRELSRTLQMPLDRMVTATRFYVRAAKADTSLSGLLSSLCSHIGEWSEGDSMRVLIRTFGFQAVESRLAVKVLQARDNEPYETPIGV